ncbi:Hypothetical protein, putative [Bodo saltans]|uniref:Uncharacterized protein n=1 Tax=Bodo saltans TaxID=75058 RepID=A0A0S4JKW9_BODSA|nr:Hypothetical protein, putative [Bodo saltans]|eukprot:CUG90762.1 Hypothetical protein, putative [Bodo saltans]
MFLDFSFRRISCHQNWCVTRQARFHSQKWYCILSLPIASGDIRSGFLICLFPVLRSRISRRKQGRFNSFRMRKTVTCFAAHPYRPQVLLGYESGILEDVSIDDEIGVGTLVSHSTDYNRHAHGRCAISSVVVGWGNNPVRFTRYLAPHESLAHPLKPLQSTKTSFVPPSPVLRHDLAVAISGCDCSLVDINLGIVCCTWVLSPLFRSVWPDCCYRTAEMEQWRIIN